MKFRVVLIKHLLRCTRRHRRFIQHRSTSMHLSKREKSHLGGVDGYLCDHAEGI